MDDINEICQNARKNGMIDDPRVSWDCDVTTDCGFVKRKGLEHKEHPKVCGNCIYYSVC